MQNEKQRHNETRRIVEAAMGRALIPFSQEGVVDPNRLSNATRVVQKAVDAASDETLSPELRRLPGLSHGETCTLIALADLGAKSLAAIGLEQVSEPSGSMT